MLASDEDLRQFIDAGWLTITPEHDDAERAALVQPASIDLRLDRHFQVMNRPSMGRWQSIDPRRDQGGIYDYQQPEPGTPMMLEPGRFTLASTWEIVTLNQNLAARIEGKSSLGRLGLIVHSTAGFIDPGFEGQITLEIVNLATRSILLWPGMAIAQLGVFVMANRADRPYGAARGSHYQGQRGPTPSRAHERFKIWELDDSRLPKEAP
jgi:dCTP deaminase